MENAADEVVHWSCRRETLITDLSNTTIESDADFVVVFEKESFFDLMIKEGVLLELFALGIKAGFVTGKGRPELNTLKLLYKLHAKYACKRYFIVTDGDPGGSM